VPRAVDAMLAAKYSEAKKAVEEVLEFENEGVISSLGMILFRPNRAMHPEGNFASRCYLCVARPGIYSITSRNQSSDSPTS
jgi:uncharacterized protein (DUF362 family)